MTDDPASGVAAGRLLAATRKRVVEVVADLEEELLAIAESTAASPDDEHDAEGSTVGFERARVGGLLARARQELDDLDAAQRRLAAGTYRRCVECGGDIGAARLEALPGTTRCVTCATKG
ncbi:TraR/DksA C4-type zinc finger protein [Acidiferrimicrobium sp. IK]|uniref:TraR/DksA family transcriptional regulator n=1 Tax=Acidiferrimicrobium sp. IK TaxID=2871700 RepID=UPI0021CB5763|nr:TraR/DksA C4-type zinc finger protein [Acidiferrimicrobium sp. IK]MCU4186031.1 TraR/DksA C4-type zinc finger protein [Acidiferrimicrobium sp. IK]